MWIANFIEFILGDYLLDARKKSIYSRRMGELITWGFPIFLGLGLIALCYAQLQVVGRGGDFRMAQFWFGLGILVLALRVVYWAMMTNRSLALRVALCIVICGTLIAITVEAFRSINHKRKVWLEVTQASSAKVKPLVEEKQWYKTPEYDLTSGTKQGVPFLAHGSLTEAIQQDATQRVEPNLIPLEPRIGYTEPVETYRIKEVEGYEYDKSYRTAIAEFSNEIVLGSEVAPLESVKARIIYYKDDKVYWRSSAGWWIENEFSTISFDPHEIQKLILAVYLEEAGYRAFANRHEHYLDESSDKLDHRVLEGDRFRVEVQLIAGGRMLGSFNYNLLLHPLFGIKQVKQGTQAEDNISRLEIAQKLEGLLEEGQTLLKKIAHAPDASALDWWEAIAKTAIAEELGELEAIEFAKNTGLKLYPYSAQSRQMVDRLYTLTERLGEIISSLRRG